jgi:hypothetical protein
MAKRTASFLAVITLLMGLTWFLAQPPVQGSSANETSGYLPLVHRQTDGGQPEPTATPGPPTPTPTNTPVPPPPDPLTREEFNEVAPQGFGDRHNSVAWSMAWWNDQLFVGTSRAYACTQAAVKQAYNDFLPINFFYPPSDPDVECTPTPQDLPLQAEIWRWTPATNSWDRVYQSPNDIEIILPDVPPGKFTSPDLGFREMQVFTEQDGTTSLYVAGATSRDFNCRRPSETGVPCVIPPPRILRSTDGATFTPIPQTPGTFFGDLDTSVQSERSERVQSLRSMAEYNGRLYVVAGGFYGHGSVIESANPAAGDNSFRQITPPDLMIYSIEPYNGQLYLGTGSQPLPNSSDPGYRVLRTDASGEPPYQFTEVVINGGNRTQGNSKTVVHMEEFEGSLYVGTNQPAELIRVNPDDTWDLIMGNPRDGRTPLSGFLDGFGVGSPDILNIHVHRMQTHEGVLYVATNDQATTYRTLPPAARPPESRWGFDLYSTVDGINYSPISINGMGDIFNESGRNFASTPYGLFLGTQNYYYGLRIYQGVHSDQVASPASLYGETTAGGAALSWEAAPGATRYRVYRSTLTPYENRDSTSARTEAWLPGAFVEIAAPQQTYFVDRTVRLDQEQYHYFVVAEGADSQLSRASNIVPVPSAATDVTFDYLRHYLDRWTLPTPAANPEEGGSPAQALDQAQSRLGSRDLQGARADLARLRASLEERPTTSLQPWRAADLAVFVGRLEQRLRLVELGLISQSAIN